VGGVLDALAAERLDERLERPLAAVCHRADVELRAVAEAACERERDRAR
jgi:hypothetical protein